MVSRATHVFSALRGRARVFAPAVVVLCTLCAAAAGYAASGTLKYSGRTSQGRSISFALDAGKITGLQYRIVDTCPGGKVLFVHDWGFPALTVTNSKFGGKFVAKKPQSATTIIHGRVSGKTVRGTLWDRTRNRKSHKFCTGRAAFDLRRAHA
jgi:hypothetical protein